MTETQTQSTTEFAVGFDTVSAWLTELSNDYQYYRHAGWQFVTTLEAGISQFSSRREVSELYDLAQQSTGLSRSRLTNLVSMARKPASRYAAANGLEIAHAEAVLGLSDEDAMKRLRDAKEEGISATAVGARIREERQRNVRTVDVPGVGNEDNNLHDVPFDTSKPNVLYEQGDDYSAEANAYAGDGDGYDWSDDDELMLNRNEARDMIEAAWRRLPADDEQRTLGEWFSLLLRNAY